MRVLIDESLSKHTTFRMGGIVKQMLIPDNVDELISIMEKEKNILFIGGGSNLLINDKKIFDNVICLKSFNKEFIYLGDGKYKVGASISLQELIKHTNDEGYGGIEYLYSVPGLVGGAVVMNAGRGKGMNKTISDYIVEVAYLKDGQIQVIKKKDCEFSHRNSIFKNNNLIILSVTFQFEKGNSLELAELRKKRITYVKKVHDTSKPNFGSVFCESNPYIMKYFKMFSGRSKVHYSKKTVNWLLNEGGSYEEAVKEINRVKRLHKLLHKKCRQEVIQWD